MHELYRPYFSDLGFIQKKLPEGFKQSGYYLEPEPSIGRGFSWIYPVCDLYSINIQHLIFTADFSYKYPHPDFISIGSYGNDMAKIMYGDLTPGPDNIIGYTREEGVYELRVNKNSVISSLSISFLPDFYEKQLAEKFNINKDCIKQILSNINGTIPIPEVETILKQLRFSRPAAAASAVYYESKVLEIISILLQLNEYISGTDNASNRKRQDIKQLKNVINYLEENYTEPVPLETLAGIAYMSRSKFTSSFKEHYGLTAVEYIQKLRVNKAKELLISSEYDIKKIASMVGYRQHASFTALFKRCTGLSPDEYRKRGMYV